MPKRQRFIHTMNIENPSKLPKSSDYNLLNYRVWIEKYQGVLHIDPNNKDHKILARNGKEIDAKGTIFMEAFGEPGQKKIRLYIVTFQGNLFGYNDHSNYFSSVTAPEPFTMREFNYNDPPYSTMLKEFLRLIQTKEELILNEASQLAGDVQSYTNRKFGL